MAIEISPENEQFLDAAVASGAYPSRDKALDHAIALLRERQQAVERIMARPVPLPQLPPFLDMTNDGYVKVRGHRIGLHLILESFFAGEDAVQIQDRFSSLTLNEVEWILAFARLHAGPLRAYLDQQQAIGRLLADDAHRGPTLEELRARWQAKYGKLYTSSCR